MAEDINDITINSSEGMAVVEELGKVILTRGAWTTILFKYREQNTKTEVWSKPKFTIRRYKKYNGVFRQQSKFNISSEAQARGICDALEGWLAEGGFEGGDDGEDGGED